MLNHWNTSSQRQVICMAYCKAAVVHAISQRVLIESGCTAPHSVSYDFTSKLWSGQLGFSMVRRRLVGEVLGASATW